MISVVVLTKNEEKNILNCLSSVTWADEIVIIDDFSTDKTLEMIKNFALEKNIKNKLKIYQRSLNQDFASQRNFGMEKSKGEWILFLDADEKILPQLAQEIQMLISKNKTDLKADEKGIQGYFIKRRDILFGQLLKHGESGHIKFLRLGRKGSGRWKRKVHEVWDIPGPTKTLKNEILHYPHSSLNDFLKSINEYSTINAKILFNEGKKIRTWEIILYPVCKFCKNYLFKLGFLDGTLGFIHAMLMSLHSFLSRSKSWVIQNKQNISH